VTPLGVILIVLLPLAVFLAALVRALYRHDDSRLPEPMRSADVTKSLPQIREALRAGPNRSTRRKP